LTLDLLSNLYIRQRQYEKAEPLYRHLLQINEQESGQTNPTVLNLLRTLIFICSKQGKVSDALVLYERLIPRLEELLGSHNKRLIEDLTEYAALLRKTNQLEKAAKVEERIKELNSQGSPTQQKDKEI